MPPRSDLRDRRGDPSWQTVRHTQASSRPVVGHEDALSVAIDTRQHDLALLLLCNRFPPDELSRHPSNRAAYGWAWRHNDDPRIAREPVIGLVEAVFEGHERAVALLVWAGA